MKIIISPAKQMVYDTDSLECAGLPHFLSKTEIIKDILQSMDYARLKKLWKCNDKIAQMNYERLQNINLRSNLTPAILSYDGIRYKYMAPSVFDTDQLKYIQEHLFILSGFYGALKPFDGVAPYRLEMGAKLPVDGRKDLYDYWSDEICRYVCDGRGEIINLASEEYSKVIKKHIDSNTKFVTVVFGEYVKGKLVEKATKCKMARGEMVRYMAENNVQTSRQLTGFNRLGYNYSRQLSDKENLDFVWNK